MGREILYCTKCGRALTADDFTRGRAHTFDHRQYCAACLPPKHDPASTNTPRPARRAPATARAPVPPPRPSVAPRILAVVAALGILAILGVLLRPAEAPPDPAAELVRDAREFAQLNPRAHDDILRRWERVLAAAGPGPLADEARREIQRASAARAQAFAGELAALHDKVRERVEAERFGAAVDVLEEARRRHAAPEWAQAVETSLKEVRATADRLYPSLKEKATAAHAKGDEAAVRDARAKLGLWSRPDLAADLEAALANVVPREEVPAAATVLLRYPTSGRPYNPSGTPGPAGLVALPYGEHAMMGGFEVIRQPFAIPARGEFWLTYSTRSAKPIVLRFRVIRGDRTAPYNWEIKAPEVGRPARVKAPLREFMNYDNQLIAVGDRVQSVYIQQDDPSAGLTFIEAAIFALP